MEILERFFALRERQTTVGRELAGGLTTFLTMSYIIFVQPIILSAAGMDKGAVMVATCLASALGSLLMGLLANYPIALAPAMGHNVFFAFTLCVALKIPWQTALALNFLSAALFVVLSFWGLREKVITAVPESLHYAIAAGIGMLIALLGLEWAGIVVDTPDVLVGLGNLKSAPALVSLAGLAVTSVFLVRNVPGAFLIGMAVTSALALLAGVTQFHGVVSAPPSLSPTLFKLDFAALFHMPLDQLFSVVFVFFFLHLFDTVGTLIGVGQRGGFMRGNDLPRARQGLLADALATVAGTLLGTSTVTAYIESTTGVTAGARTGLANVFTALLFLLALVFYPVAEMIGGGYTPPGSQTALHPILAPVLVLVGVYMITVIRKIEWDDFSEAVPAFLTIMVMVFSMSITEGIAFGFISYALLKLAAGRFREVHALVYVFAALFILRYAFLKA